MKHDLAAVDGRRPEEISVADDMDRTVAMTPVRDADRSPRALGLSLPTAQRTARVAELRRLVADGMYATESMMDVIARKILRSGDL
jgi:hypothetical protein